MSNQNPTPQELAEAGCELFMDIYEGHYQRTSEIVSAKGNEKIRLAIFHAKNGRFADPNLMDDELACRQPDISILVNEIVFKAELSHDGMKGIAEAHTSDGVHAVAKLMKEKRNPQAKA